MFARALEDSLGDIKAKGALRFDMGQSSNVDMQCVAMPLVLTAKPNPRARGCVVVSLKFPTVHVNGAFGSLRFPAMLKGMLKKHAHRDQVVMYIRHHVPRLHYLRRTGWCGMAYDEYELADDVAVPAHSDSESDA